MKKTLTLIAVFAVCILSGSAVAQEKAQVKIKKEVRMDDVNGVKTLTIITTTNGKPSEETFTGEEAEAKLAEMMDGRGETDEVKKEIDIVEIDGLKKVTITTSKKGKIRTEVYTGEDADKILEEMDSESSGNVIKTKESKSVKK
jgi:hypothetical protein